LAQVSGLDPREQEGGNPIIDFLLRLQHIVLIIDQELLQFRVLQDKSLFAAIANALSSK
jgi:hypothetical protein